MEKEVFVSRQRTIATGCFALTAALLVALVSRDQARAELVLRLDAMDTSKITLSTDVTADTFDIGGTPFPDPRTNGLNFVEAWGQSFGATSNSAFHPTFLPLPDANNLTRPTYDPNGLGAGLPTVNFDLDPNVIVLAQGQRLYAPLDNLIYNDNYSIFFVAKAVPTPGTNTVKVAFGQDLDFRVAGWDVDAGGGTGNRWRGSIRGTGTAATVASATSGSALNTAAAVRSVVGDATSVDFDTVTSSGGINTLDTLNTVPAAGNNTAVVSGGEFSIGNRGGTAISNRAFNGMISEIAIFNTKLTTDERDAINAFLANKWLGGPAPTGAQVTTATTLLQQAPPTVGAPQLVRYQFWKEPNNPDQTDVSILVPEVVASGVTASNFGSQTGAVLDVDSPSGIAISALGIAANSLFLSEADDNVATWHTPGEKTPADAGASFMTFTVTPDAGKVIDPASLAFAFERDGLTLEERRNAADSFGVWINDGSGFTKVGGQVGIDGPLGAADIADSLYDTFTVDLTGVAPFTATTEIRIYMWHDGPQLLPADYNGDGHVNLADYVVWRKAGPTDTLLNDGVPGSGVDSTDYDLWVANYGDDVNQALKARVDNVRLRGNVLNAGSGSGSANVPEPASIISLLLGGLLTLSRCGRRRRRNAPF